MPLVISVAMLLSLICSLSIVAVQAEQSVAATAQEIQPLQVGQVAPRFDVKTVDNEVFSFDPTSLERPAMLVSFRGGWCPYCNMHLSELRTVVPEISAMGVDVMFLSGDRPEMLYASLMQDTQEDIADLDYKIYSDADAQAAIALGIAFKASDRTLKGRHERGDDIEDSSMARHGVLPVPAVFVVDREGMITFAYANPDYKIRLSPDELLAAASAIATRE